MVILPIRAPCGRVELRGDLAVTMALESDPTVKRSLGGPLERATVARVHRQRLERMARSDLYYEGRPLRCNHWIFHLAAHQRLPRSAAVQHRLSAVSATRQPAQCLEQCVDLVAGVGGGHLDAEPDLVARYSGIRRKSDTDAALVQRSADRVQVVRVCERDSHEPNQWLAHSHAQEAAIQAADLLIELARNERDLLVRYDPQYEPRIRVVGNGIDDSAEARAAAG